MHFKLIDKIAANFSLKSLRKIAGVRFLPMVYHVVGHEDEMPYLKGLYQVPSPKDFSKDIDFLLKHYKPLELPELMHYNKTGELPGKGNYFHLSFDDGLRQCSEIIAPILKHKGVPATFFLNTGFIGNNAFLHRFKTVLLDQAIKADRSDGLKKKVEEFFNLQFTCRYKAAKHVFALRYPQLEQITGLIDFLGLDINGDLKKHRPYMDKQDVQKLISEGHTIGAHTIHHPEFFLISEEDQLQQAIGSLNDITSWFNPDYKVFAFPFTDDGVSLSFFDKLNQQTGVDLTFACAGLKKNPIKNNMHRIAMDNYELRAEQRLKSELLYYILKAPFGKNTIRRK